MSVILKPTMKENEAKTKINDLVEEKELLVEDSVLRLAEGLQRWGLDIKDIARPVHGTSLPWVKFSAKNDLAIAMALTRFRNGDYGPGELQKGIDGSWTLDGNPSWGQSFRIKYWGEEESKAFFDAAEEEAERFGKRLLALDIIKGVLI